MVNGSAGGHVTMVNTAAGGIGGANGGAGAIVNNVTTGVASYNVGSGIGGSWLLWWSYPGLWIAASAELML